MASPGTTNAPSIVMFPANDAALNLSVLNERMNNGTGYPAFAGVPALARYNLAGASGLIPLLTYAPPLNSIGIGGNAGQFAAPTQLLGDVNIGQMWQYGIKASQFLYSDTAFAALPNATTLYAGQILAPPAYWNEANGQRYALDVVYQSGTTGTPNGGATTCETTSTAAQFACTNATDLSIGQYITVGTNAHEQISLVDAANPANVLVNVTGSVGTISTPTALAFSAPVLGPEIQMPTKSSTAPATLAWSQGDMLQNSGAVASGICGWVNVAAGTPGTWTAIPCANASGQINLSQVTNGTQSTSPVCPNGTGGSLTTSGCTGAGAPSTVRALNAYVANTGSTTNNQAASLTIPAGTLDATGKLVATIQVDSCGGAAWPYTSCTAANSGTCTVLAYLSTSNSGTTGIRPFGQTVAAHQNATITVSVRAQNSTTSQVLGVAVVGSGGGSTSGVSPATNPSSMNMAVNQYLNIFIQNSVSTDTCFLSQADVVVWP